MRARNRRCLRRRVKAASLCARCGFEPNYIAIIDHLASVRQAKGLSQKRVGLRCGAGQVFVSRVELKQRRLDVWEFVRLCRALEIDPGEVLRTVESAS